MPSRGLFHLSKHTFLCFSKTAFLYTISRGEVNGVTLYFFVDVNIVLNSGQMEVLLSVRHCFHNHIGAVHHLQQWVVEMAQQVPRYILRVVIMI